jgi:putative ABC transport system permease protein
MGRLFTGFSLTALMVACLGLYGLTAFAVEARTREIGIRKSIGASGADIFMMLIRTFLKWVLIANCIAWPMVYWFNEGWLNDFPYRVKTNLGIMILAGLAALVIALATVGWKVRKAAGANPVDALRYE